MICAVLYLHPRCHPYTVYKLNSFFYINLSVIVDYAQTVDAADADKDVFYNDLASVIKSVLTHDNLLM